jgi:benzylsuccinate CoA-transferase BbsF subunit
MQQKVQMKPLDGIRIAEFGFFIVGPLTGKILADYGAEVIKIESATRPDPHRNIYPFKDEEPGLDRAGRFHPYNTSKLSVTLNLSMSEGVEVAKRIVAHSDIVIENFAGGVMERMGLGYDELVKVNPKLIMLSSSMQGQTGPHSKSQGLGWQLTALSGFFSVAGWPEMRPLGPDGPYTDYIAPHFNVLGILGALDHLRRTGEGQFIDASQYENGVHFLAPLVLDYSANKRIAGMMGNRHPDAAPHGAYRCLGSDRWCVIAVFTDEEWLSFRKTLGYPEWSERSEFSTHARRKLNENELDRLVESWTLEHSPEKVTTILQAAGVSAGMVQVTGEEVLDKDPQLKSRRFIRELDHPELGKHRAPGVPFRLSKSPYDVQRSPLLGEHNEYVLKQVAGMTDDEIADIVVDGVVE